MTHNITFTRGNSSEEFSLLEPGWYGFTIANIFETSKEGEPLVTRDGTPFLKMVCEESLKGQALLYNLFLDPGSAPRVSAFLHAVGYEFQEGEVVDISPGLFQGRSFRGRVEFYSGNDGKKRNRITRVAPPEKEEPPEEEEEEKEATPLDDIWGSPEEPDEVPF